MRWKREKKGGNQNGKSLLGEYEICRMKIWRCIHIWRA